LKLIGSHDKRKSHFSVSRLITCICCCPANSQEISVPELESKDYQGLQTVSKETAIIDIVVVVVQVLGNEMRTGNNSIPGFANTLEFQ